MKCYRIGALAQLLNLTPDTLRYYERFGLLPRVARAASGIRCYSERDHSRLRFIQRAQSMNFSLAEIKQLLDLRDRTQAARGEARAVVHHKLAEVEARLEELAFLREELRSLIERCQDAQTGCPIVAELEQTTTTTGADRLPFRASNRRCRNKIC